MVPAGSDRSYRLLRSGVALVVPTVGGVGEPSPVYWGLVKTTQEVPRKPNAVRRIHRAFVRVNLNIWGVRVIIWRVGTVIWSARTVIRNATPVIRSAKILQTGAAILKVTTIMFGAKL